MTITRMEPERPELSLSSLDKVHHLKSLEKGLALLEVFGPDAPAMTMTELAQRCGYHLSTVQRLTATLCRLGYLKRDSSKRYHLGLKVIRLGFRVTQTMALRTFLLPYLQDLFDIVDQTINLFLPDHNEVVIVERLEKCRILQYNLRTGSSLPMYCTAAGKAILSFMDKGWIHEFLKRVRLKAYTPYTLTDPEKLMEALDRSRKQGYALNIQELGMGACAVGMAIFDKNRIPCGAISIACPAQDFDVKLARKRYLTPLKETTFTASQFMGRDEE